MSADPLSGNHRVTLTTADAKALGYTVTGVTYDSTLTFSNTTNIFEYTGTPTPGEYDFRNVAEHELDEALGIGSALTGLANNAVIPTTTSFAAEDYFRYSAAATRGITTNPNAVIYFSYDGGATSVAVFNQNNNAGGNSFADRNDWVYGNSGCPAQAPGPFIQDAIGCPNVVIKLTGTSPEVKTLASLGWDLAIPEPGTLLLAAGAFAAALLRRCWKHR